MIRLSARHAMAVLAALLTTGCVSFFEPYEKTHFYDFGIPSANSELKDISFVPARKSLPRDVQMAFRTAPNCVVYDQFNRWTTSPGRLLCQYLELATASTPDDSQLQASHIVETSILCCECDLVAKEARMIVRVAIRSRNSHTPLWCQTFDLKSKLPDGEVTADRFAEANSRLAAELARKLKAKLTEIQTPPAILKP